MKATDKRPKLANGRIERNLHCVIQCKERTVCVRCTVQPEAGLNLPVAV